MSHYYYPNRTLCSVLEEMRKRYETRNFADLLGLIEEAQSAANRMEAGLSDTKDIRKLVETRSKLRKEVKDLENKKKNLGSKSED